MELENNNLSTESSLFSVFTNDFMTIYFKIHYRTKLGFSVYVIGSG